MMVFPSSSSSFTVDLPTTQIPPVDNMDSHQPLENWLHLRPPTPPDVFYHPGPSYMPIPYSPYSLNHPSPDCEIPYLGGPSFNHPSPSYQPSWGHPINTIRPLSPSPEMDVYWPLSDIRENMAPMEFRSGIRNSGGTDPYFELSSQVDYPLTFSAHKLRQTADHQRGAFDWPERVSDSGPSWKEPAEELVSVDSGNPIKNEDPGAKRFLACGKTSPDSSHVEHAKSFTKVHVGPKNSVFSKEDSDPSLYTFSSIVKEPVPNMTAWEMLNQNASDTSPAVGYSSMFSFFPPPSCSISGGQHVHACNDDMNSSNGKETPVQLHVGGKDGYSGTDGVGNDLKSNCDLFVSSSKVKHDMPLNREPTTSWRPRFQREKSNFVQSKIPTYLKCTPPCAGRYDFGECSSMLLDQTISAENSPFWKGDPVSKYSPLGFMQVDECSGYGQQNQTPAINVNVAEAASSKGSIDPESGSLKDGFSSFFDQSPSVVGCLSTEHLSTDGYITGSDYSKVGEESRVQSSDGMQESGNKHVLLLDPDIKNFNELPFSHEDNIVTFAAPSALETCIADPMEVFNCPARDGSYDLLSHLSVSSGIADIHGADDISREHLLPSFNAQGLVKMIHNLSELLLTNHCLDGLKEHDYKALQLAIYNLNECSAKKVELLRSMPNSNPELRCSCCLRKFTNTHQGTLLRRSHNSGMQANDIPNTCAFNREEKINSYKPNEEIDKLRLDSASIDLEKDNGIAQAFKKAMKDSSGEQGEKDPKGLLYRDLWIEAEAALCSMKYELRLARMSIEFLKLQLLEDTDSQNASDVAAKLINLDKPSSANVISGTSRDDTSSPKTNQCSPLNSTAVADDVRQSSCGKPKEMNTSDTDCHYTSDAANKLINLEIPSSRNAISDSSTYDTSLPKTKRSSIENMITAADDVKQGSCGKSKEMNMSAMDEQTIDTDFHDASDAASKCAPLEKPARENAMRGSNWNDTSSLDPTQSSNENSSVTEGDVRHSGCGELKEMNSSGINDDTEDVHASVMARFRILQNRMDHKARQQHHDAVDIGTRTRICDLEMENNVEKDSHPTKIVDLGFVEKNKMCPFIKDCDPQEDECLEAGAQDPEEVGLSSDASEEPEMTRNFHVFTEDGIAAQLCAPSWPALLGHWFPHGHGSLSPTDGYDSLSVDWEHVSKEEIPL